MLKDNYASDYAEQLLVKAKIWVKAGDSEKAVPLYQKALAIKDSASMSLANNQMEQIKSSYQLDKINMEQQRHNNRIRLIFLAVIIVVLFVLFIFHVPSGYGTKGIETFGKPKSAKPPQPFGKRMK